MSRELYDACRTYKHFYRKHEDVKSWNEKYHDIDLSDAINKTTGQLREATHNLQGILFKELKVDCREIHSQFTDPIMPMGRFGSRLSELYYNGTDSTVEFWNSREFLYCLAKHMENRRYE